MLSVIFVSVLRSAGTPLAILLLLAGSTFGSGEFNQRIPTDGYFQAALNREAEADSVPDFETSRRVAILMAQSAAAGSASTTDQATQLLKKNYFVEARSVGTQPESDPPKYVRTLSKTGIPAFSELDWLDFNADFRLRYEYRDDDVRRPVAVLDEPFLLRTRAYIGVHDVFDPFRFVIEYEDAQRENSQFSRDDRDINEYEFIQAYGELYFDDALGEDRPLRFQVGRMAMEYVDRRLIARNEWRNTTNNFQGFRAILGQQQNDWQLDILALQPVERLLVRLDRQDEQRWFWGAIGNWRRWSEIITLQPYYLILNQDGDSSRPERDIHSIGLRGYGILSDTGFDYDGGFIFQIGNHAGQSVSAFGMTSEIGYSFDQPWKPRLSAFFGYASGDKDPLDNSRERFDRLFGFARPWSASDYIIFENLIAPKTRLEFQPHQKVRVDTGYSAYWLASDTDSFANASLRDPTGQSGSFMGHEIDARLRVKAHDHIDVTLGYSHFIPGEFTRNTGKPDDTDFFYVETTIRLLK